MADERKFYAGDLASFAVGHRVRSASVVGEPMIDQIQHYRDMHGEARTLLDFESGVTVDLPENTLVEVLP